MDKPSEIDAQKWRRLRDLLDQALDAPTSERQNVLRNLSVEDADLREDLRRLLSQYERTQNLLEGNAADLAARLLSEENERAAQETLGRHFGPYRLIRLLGIGGMGMVYLAERAEGKFTQTVALKVVQIAGSISMHQRFESERRILARLTHPHIAMLYDGGELADGQAFYTMEYVEGVPITQFCLESACSVEQRIHLIQDVAKALSYAHRNLVVHRDIKPSNILVTSTGQVKLLDFGIAKMIGNTGEAALTRTGAAPMTSSYAAPEQFRNETITAATDIYQLGVLCFQLLTGAMPYRADPTDTYAWARAVADEDSIGLADALDPENMRSAWAGKIELSRLRRQLSGDLDAITRKALAKEPDQRYGSMDALIADLQAFLGGRPVRARRAGPMYFAWRFMRRHRYIVGVTATAIIGLAMMAGYAFHEARRAEHDAEKALQQAARAEAAVGYIADLFRVVDPGQTRGEQITAQAILEQGAKQLESGMADQPALRGHLQTLLGEIYITFGDLPRALPLLNHAIDALRMDNGGDPLTLARALELAASVAFRSGHVEQGLAWLAQANILAVGDSEPAANIRIDGLRARSILERDRGNEAKSQELIEQALELSRHYDQGRVSSRTAQLMWRYGIALRDVERFDESGNALRQARESFTTLHGPDDVRTIGVELTQAWLLTGMKNYDAAESAMAISAEHIRTILGTHSTVYANNRFDAALLHLARGKLEQARDEFLETAKLYGETAAPNSISRASALLNAATIELDGQHPAEALSLLTDARIAWSDGVASDNPILGTISCAIAEAQTQLGQLDAAVASANEGIAILSKQDRPEVGNIVSCLQERVHIEWRRLIKYAQSNNSNRSAKE